MHWRLNLIRSYVAACLCSLQVTPATAQAAKPPTAPQPLALPPAQAELLSSLAQEEFCGCDSALTLAQCLDKRPDCSLAVYLQRIMAQLLDDTSEPGSSQRRHVANLMSQTVLGPFCSPPIKFDWTEALRHAGHQDVTAKPGQAPITLLEFADFRCSHCRDAALKVHDALEQLRAKAAFPVQFVFAPIAIGQQPLSLAAAEAALAAGAQNKFWPMHAALFARRDGDFSSDVLAALARQVGLNMTRFRKEMQAHTYAPAVAALQSQAQLAGLEGTPAFFVNGRPFTPIDGIVDFETRFAMEQVRQQKACQ